MTPAEFKTLKPQFATAPDAIVQMYLDMAGRWVDSSWPASDAAYALAAMTCHLMTLEGLGTDAASKAFASGESDYTSIKSGELAITKKAAATGQVGLASWLGQTKCGQYYALLLRTVRAGPIGISVAAQPCGFARGYVKDGPL